MTKFLVFTLAGLSDGAVYAAFALALVMIWRATGVLNFAQGSMAMISAYLAVSVVDRGYGYWWAFTAALVGGLLIGAVTERLVIRRVQHAPPLNAVVVTLGLFVLLEAVAGLIWGNNNRTLPTPFSTRGFIVNHNNYGFSPFNVFVVVSVAGTALALGILFRFTRIGLAMRASAFSAEVSRLVGVRVGRMLTLGWALAAVVGALAGLLVAEPGRAFVSPAFLEGANIIGFTAAIAGGLESPTGAVVGGLGVGLALSYVSGYVNSDFALPAAVALLLVVLMIRPRGLFSRARARVV